MKSYLLMTVLLIGHLPAFGALKEEDLDHFENNVEIAGVRADTWRSEDREKYELLQVNTFQSEDDPDNYNMSDFRIRLVVELTDKQDNIYLVRFTGTAPEYYDSEYKGEDYWGLYMAHGDYERLKISGYIVQYGYMDGENFIPLVNEEDDAEEILRRVRNQKTLLFPGKVYLRHYYMYDDSGSGLTESNPSNVRPVKE